MRSNEAVAAMRNKVVVALLQVVFLAALGAEAQYVPASLSFYNAANPVNVVASVPLASGGQGGGNVDVSIDLSILPSLTALADFPGGNSNVGRVDFRVVSGGAISCSTHVCTGHYLWGADYCGRDDVAPYALYGDGDGALSAPDAGCALPATTQLLFRVAVERIPGFDPVWAVYSARVTFVAGAPEPVPAPVPGPAPAPTEAPVPGPVPAPTAAPTAAPVPAPVAPSTATVSEMYVIQEGDKSKLNYAMGHHHLIYQNGAAQEPEVWFHGLEQYNLAVEVPAGVTKLELEGYYYRYYAGSLLTGEQLTIYKKTYQNTQPGAQNYYFLDGTEDRTTGPTSVAAYRREPGDILLEAGEFHLTATPYNSAGAPGVPVTVVVDVRANPQRAPLFDEGVTLEVEVWKDPIQWQYDLRSSDPDSGDLVSSRDWYFSRRLSCVTSFKTWVYITHEKWGTVFRVPKGDSTSRSSGLELFLDVYQGMNDYGPGSTLGNGNFKHAGLRSVALHPDGTSDDGLVYVSAMETKPPTDQLWRVKYIQRDYTSTPVDEESSLVEFRYANGKGIPSSYRLLFRVECPQYDHTIRQIRFRGQYLYVEHGDGSIDSAVVGKGQDDDALGKILRIDPLNGKNINAQRDWGEYSTAGNPFDFSGNRPLSGAAPAPLNVNDPTFGYVPKETYSMGHRNPHGITFANDGTFIVGEASRNHFEEINVVVEGGNYGWAHFEGPWRQMSSATNNNMFYTATPPTMADHCPACNFRFPAVAMGHNAWEGLEFNKIALAGGHVVENGSPVHAAAQYRGKYFHCDFPYTGKFFYNYLQDLKDTLATATNPSVNYQPATTYKAKFRFNGVVYPTFRDVVASLGLGFNAGSQIDIRIGNDEDGCLYIFSKVSGYVWKVTNSC
mmetsp:Transcript_10774/g.32413  ORF Transcript_10774/g.32413 Transcript_10774/m.32413 type:complete len:893 (+) Transcript_10774:93-2771(+)